MTTPVRRARRRVLDAPHLPIALYLLVVGLQGRDVFDGTIPLWLNTAWALILVVGALLIVWGVAGERSRAESTGHAFHICGLVLLAAIVLTELDDDVSGLVALACVSALRMRVLSRSRAARREAGRLLERRGGPS